jgi:LacI family transcriptional regulator
MPPAPKSPGDEPKPRPASLADVASEADVSKSTASYALRNHHCVSKATCLRVQRIAKKLSYSRDARLGDWMRRVRDTKAKGLLPIAWLNTQPNFASYKDVKYLSPYLEGAQARCLELGYYIEEIWTYQPGLTMRRVSSILHHRGIQGVVICPMARHVQIRCDRLSAVTLGGSLLIPRLHRVGNNDGFNLMLAFRSLKRLGYRRIGVCLTEQVDRFSQHVFRSTMYYWNSTIPASWRVEPLIHPHNIGEEKFPDVKAWLHKEKPEVVICHDGRMVEWVQASGFRVPGQIGVAHLAIDDDVLDWGGINSNRRIMGQTAVELVIGMLQNSQFGLPEFPADTLIKGSWRHGRTLRRA